MLSDWSCEDRRTALTRLPSFWRCCRNNFFLFLFRNAWGGREIRTRGGGGSKASEKVAQHQAIPGSNFRRPRALRIGLRAIDQDLFWGIDAGSTAPACRSGKYVVGTFLTQRLLYIKWAMRGAHTCSPTCALYCGYCAAAAREAPHSGRHHL